MNDYIYSSYFPSSRLAGTVLRPGFAGPLLHAPSSYWTQYFDLGTCWTLITAATGGNHLRPVKLPEQQTRRDIPARAQLRAADRFANRIFHRSIRSVGLEPNADRFGSHPFRWTHISAVMTPAYATQFDSNHIRSASTSTRTAPVDDQLPPRRSPQRRFIVLPVLRQFFHNFFVITSASRSDRDLSLFSFSFAPYPVLRSLRLSLTGWYRDHSLFTCLVLFPFPLGWLRAISHRSSSHIHREPIILCPLPRHSST